MTFTVTKSREHYLDNLKVALTVLVIFHHAGQAYGPGGEWIVKRAFADEYCAWLGNLFSVNAAFFMGLFFLISGYFVPVSFDKAGCARFVWKKLQRLALPLVLFIALPFSLLAHSIQLAHGWYLEHLLVYCLVYAVLARCCGRSIKPRLQGPSLWVFAAIAMGLAVITALVRSVSPQDHWEDLLGFLRSEPCHLPQYVLMFGLGIVAQRTNWFSTMSNRVGFTLLWVGVVLSIVKLVEPILSLPFSLWDYWGVYEPLLAVSLCFGLIVLFRQRFNAASSIMSFLARNAFGAYVFHFGILLLVQFSLDPLLHIGAWHKVLLFTAITVVLSFAQTWLLRLVPGVKSLL